MAGDVLDRLLTTLAVRIHAFAVCEIRAGWRLAFDSMEGVVVHHVLRGRGTLRALEREVAFAPGSIVVVPAGHAQDLGTAGAPLGTSAAAEHCSLRPDGMIGFTAGAGDDDILVVCATVTASYGGELGLFEHLRAPLHEAEEAGAALDGLFATMLREVSRPALGTQALVEAVMKQCLILVLRRHLAARGPASPLLAVLHDERLARAVVAILEQPATAHTVESLAGIAGMSRSTFAARFSETYGHGPIEFVGRVRLRIGTDLLRSTALPVKVVARSIGYASRSHFTQAFRALHGIDPTSYRERTGRSKAELALATEPTLAEQAKTALRGAIE